VLIVFSVITVECWQFEGNKWVLFLCKVHTLVIDKMNSFILVLYEYDSLWKMITVVQRALIFIVVGFYHQSGY
jgi:hypothetical protein